MSTTTYLNTNPTPTGSGTPASYLNQNHENRDGFDLIWR